MSNLMCFENSFVDIANNDGVSRIKYMRCDPPARLKPKGTIILLHDLGKSNDQFADVIDLFAMGGYHTIAPDVPGTELWLHRSSSDRGTTKDSSACLARFVEGLKFPGSLHLVAVGQSVESATELTGRYPVPVNTVVAVKIGSNVASTATTMLSMHEKAATRIAYTNISDCPEATPESFLIRVLSFINKHTTLVDQQRIEAQTSSATKARL